MGKFVQVKATVPEVRLPPLNLPYISGETATLTDKEYNGLSTSTKAAIIVVKSGLADPVRSTAMASPSNATDAYRLAKAYADEAIRALTTLGLNAPAEMATHSEVDNALTSAKSYTDTKVSTSIATEVSSRTAGDTATLSSANTYTDTHLASEATSRVSGDSAMLGSANGYTDTQVASAVSGFNSAISALGLGSAAVHPATDFDQAGAAAAAQTTATTYTDTQVGNRVRVDADQGLSTAQKRQGRLNIAARAELFAAEKYGAVADGVTNDGTALQNAMNAVRDAGGGTVQLLDGKLYGWSGNLVVPSGVILRGGATRQTGSAEASSGTVSGLIALDSTARLYIGQWAGGGTNNAPGGASNLYVNGAYVAGGDGSIPADALVRVEASSAHLDRVHVYGSSGNGITFNATQNSEFIGLNVDGHVGDAVVICGGAGALTFVGGHWGSSRRCLNITAGAEAQLYPFGPVQNTFNGVIFELYTNTHVPARAGCIEISAGQQNVFYGCNFTGNNGGTTNGCLALITNAHSAVGSTVVFDSCLWGAGSTDPDSVRIVGGQYVTFEGFQQFTTGQHIICQDSGSARLQLRGELFSSAITAANAYRQINGGTTTNWYNKVDNGTIEILRTGAWHRFQRETDLIGQYRGYIDQDMAIRWSDGAGGGVKASIIHDGSGTLTHNGKTKLSGGFIKSETVNIVSTVGATVTVDAAATTVAFVGLLTNCTVTSFSIANPVDGAELTLQFGLSSGNAITWPASIAFANNQAPVLDAGVTLTIGLRYNSGDTLWHEMWRSPNRANAIGFTPASGLASTDLQAAVVEAAGRVVTVTWAPSTAYAAYQRVLLPTGGYGYSTTARTSGTSFDATERATWTFAPGGHYETFGAGSSNWKCPTGITAARVRGIGGGAGGGGGGSALTSGGVATQAGGGGGSAAGYFDQEITGLVGGTNYAYVVGAGGGGGNGGAVNSNAGASGSAGSDTVFTGPSSVTYTGHSGLPGSGGAANSTANATGGLFGVPFVGAPSGTFYSGSGGYSTAGCIANGLTIGGGGGGKATTTNGGNGGNARTAVGIEVLAPSGTTANANGGNGAAPTMPGCGGAGGGGGAPSGTGGNGGAGAAGVLEIWF